MIPKVIHYCWFGRNPLPEDAKRNIASWKKYCPDYEIREWNESNFDVNGNTYCREAYEAKKWAFVSDYARLKILYDYGGIYMDTDVEVCRSLDDLLKYNAFSGFESGNRIPTGTLGSTQGAGWIGDLLSYYKDKHFKKADGSLDLTTNVVTITRMTKEKYNIRLDDSFQILGDNMVLLPFEYLTAKDLMDGKIKKTKNTYTIHHYSGSWLSPSQRFKQQVKVILVKIGGRNAVSLIKKVLHIGE